jgi:hypothetical protein
MRLFKAACKAWLEGWDTLFLFLHFAALMVILLLANAFLNYAIGIVDFPPLEDAETVVVVLLFGPLLAGLARRTY